MKSQQSSLVSSRRPPVASLETLHVFGRSVSFSSSIEDIPFESILESKKNAMLVLDCDGTIARHDDPEIDPLANQAIFDEFSRGLISSLVLISNNRNESLMRARARNMLVPPDTLYMPRKYSEIKPRPYMILQAMYDHAKLPQQSVAVGDGITDAIAYGMAGIRSIIVQPYGVDEARGYPFRSMVRSASNAVLRWAGVNR